MSSSPGALDRVYTALIRQRDEQALDELPDAVRRDVPANGTRMVAAHALQSSGDQAVSPSTVLPWVFATLGVPSALVGLLVPLRESGSMLPQALLTPVVLRARHRKWVFVAGSAIQAAAVAGMAAATALGQGLTAGILILVALAVFAFGRCLCSISSKDVKGRTIPKGERGQITGLATTAAGVVAITLGLLLRVLGGEQLSAATLAWVLAAGAALWVGVALVYASITEPADDPAARTPATDTQNNGDSTGHDSDHDTGPRTGLLALLREDREFRSFVTVRSLLLVTSLSPPFIVALALQSGTDALAGLGGFIIASGVASLVGGRLFGPMADRSSRRVMSLAAGIGSVAVLAVVGAAALPAVSEGGLAATVVFVGGYFAVTLMHTGVRVGRQTYIVDMATGDQRTAYTAVSNTVLGVVLLVVGGISSLLALIHVSVALAFLAVMGLLGVVLGRRLPEVSGS
ncbi:MAG: MFS transporter [Micrococcus sp.]|nr:MFS transporter [Micrococcus sp.]